MFPVTRLHHCTTHLHNWSNGICYCLYYQMPVNKNYTISSRKIGFVTLLELFYFLKSLFCAYSLFPTSLRFLIQQHLELLHTLQERVLKFQWQGIMGDVFMRLTSKEVFSVYGLYMILTPDLWNSGTYDLENEEAYTVLTESLCHPWLLSLFDLNG